MSEESVFYGPNDDLSKAPKAVQEVRVRGCAGISFFPKGYTSMDRCGCCFTDHTPGWYERVPRHKEESPETSPLKIICCINGKEIATSRSSSSSILDCY